MNFRFQVQTCQFAHKSVVKLVLNLSTLIINISFGRSLKHLEMLHIHNTVFQLQDMKFFQFNLITENYPFLWTGASCQWRLLEI